MPCSAVGHHGIGSSTRKQIIRARLVSTIVFQAIDCCVPNRTGLWLVLDVVLQAEQQNESELFPR